MINPYSDLPHRYWRQLEQFGKTQSGLVDQISSLDKTRKEWEAELNNDSSNDISE